MTHFHKIVFALCAVVISCKNERKESTAEVAVAVESTTTSSVKSIADTIPQYTLSEDFITDTLFSLNEVKDANKNIQKVTKNEHGVAFMIDPPCKEDSEYFIRVGYNGPDRFETYHFFHIHPITKQISIMERTEGTWMTMEEWRKWKKEQ